MNPYRHIIVISAAEQSAANTLALSLDPAGGAATFTVGLSTDGTEPATHYWCSTVSTEALSSAMYASQGSLTSVKWWRVDRTSGVLIDTNTEHGTVGESWSVGDVLTALGLSKIESEVI